MIVADEETQLTADMVTVHRETFRMSFMTSDFANTQKFKNLLNRNTIALSYFGGDGDLELLKEYVAQLKWERRTGVKALGIEILLLENSCSIRDCWLRVGRKLRVDTESV